MSFYNFLQGNISKEKAFDLFCEILKELDLSDQKLTKVLVKYWCVLDESPTPEEDKLAFIQGYIEDRKREGIIAFT